MQGTIRRARLDTAGTLAAKGLPRRTQNRGLFSADAGAAVRRQFHASLRGDIFRRAEAGMTSSGRDPSAQDGSGQATAAAGRPGVCRFAAGASGGRHLASSPTDAVVACKR